MQITRRLNWLVAVLLIATMPVCAQQQQDPTRYFKEQVQDLIDDEFYEIRSGKISEYDGILAYADRRPPKNGDVEVFTSVNLKTGKPFQTKAVLKKVAAHCYIYVEQGQRVTSKILNKIAYHFDKRIYPRTREMFGSEWSPGIDGDKRITLLLMDIRDSYDPSRGQKGFTAGYFNAADQFRRSKNPISNQREMLYLDIYPGKPGSNKFLSVLAHEFQHMIHFNHDPKEFDWVDESLSQLSPFLSGYGHPNQLVEFLRSPDNNLVAWSNETTLANYGQVYLWSYYISTHISTTEDRRKAFVRRMVAQKSQGLSGLNAAIKKQRIKTNVANIFKSFCLANYLNDSRIDGGAYGYNKYLAKLRLRPGQYVRGNPARGKSNVKCWSSRAVEIRNKAFFGNKIRVSFAGQQLKADRYTNKFDVAFVSYCSKNKALPSVDWLAVRKYVATREIDVPRNHDKMFLLVVHRGPEVMKVEQAFAKGAGPAAFKFSVSMGSNPQIRLSRNTTETDSIMSLSMLQSSLDKIAAADFLEDVSTEILARKDQTDEVIPANAVKYELELEKLLELETNTISNLRISVKDGNYDLIEGFIAFYNSVNEEEKSRLDSLKTRLKDILKFEQLQGNDEPGVYLKELDD